MSTLFCGYAQFHVRLNCKPVGQFGTELNDKAFILQFNGITCGNALSGYPLPYGRMYYLNRFLSKK